MSFNVAHAERLIENVSSDYMGKIFYFSLKKTGSRYEAEDLTSDIMLNIIGELRKGTIPVYLSAWVWQIARNRYSVWAANKHKSGGSFSLDESDGVRIPDTEQTEEKYIREEEKNLLRRELAFISSEYRDIVVAYYIDDRKVRDIAVSLGIPEGTVKTKLFQSRKILKEGMKMAREFGVRSYKPENVNFVKSGNEG